MASGSSSSSSVNVVASGSGSSSSSVASSVVPSLGDKPNQPTLFSFPKRSFGKKDPVFGHFNHRGLRNGLGSTMTRPKTHTIILLYYLFKYF